MERDAGLETRVALVLYGGVSLAVYIFGAVEEFRRLASGAGAYGGLLRELNTRASVDIVAGASAGGINAVLLGVALAHGVDLGPAREMWLQAADAGPLLARAGPEALLDTGYFERMTDRLLHALGRQAERNGSRPRAAAFDAFITATDLAGGRLDLTDAAGRDLGLPEWRKVFHLKLRRSGSGFSRYDRDDFDVRSPANRTRLRQVCRATSAFPGAFAPELFTRAAWPELFGPRDADPAWFADGGILDNKPVGHALRAIYSRAADRRVDRLLFWVDPDPDRPSSPAAVFNRPETPGPLSTAAAAVDLQAKQSISGELQALGDRNRRLGLYRRWVRDLIAGRAPGGGTAEGGAAYLELRRAVAAGDVAARLRAALGGGKPAPDRLERAVDRRIASVPNWLDRFDLGFELRRLYFLIEQLGIYREQFYGEPRWEDDLRQLERVEARLWQAFDLVRHLEWLAGGPEAGAAAMMPTGWRDAYDAFVAACGGASDSRDGREGRLDACLAALERLLGVGLEDARAMARDAHRSAVLPLARLEPAAVAQVERWRLTSSAWEDAWRNFARIDGMLLPLESIGGLIARDPVADFRISPRDATALLGPLDPENADHKLAGDRLAHFGGFLSAQWRANDLMWGRLDAVEAIVGGLVDRARRRGQLTPAAAGAMAAAYVRRLQHEVLDEELQGVPGAPPPGGSEEARYQAYREYLAHRHRASLRSPADLGWNRVRGLVGRFARNASVAAGAEVRRAAAAAWKERRNPFGGRLKAVALALLLPPLWLAGLTGRLLALGAAAPWRRRS